MSFDRGDIKERIREANDIADVVGSYIPLKRAGSGFKALCPFHDEKTPSFNVNPRLQWFTCFGCGEKGDVFTFVQKMERVDFPEAMRMLAQRAGIEMPDRFGSDPETSRRHRRGKELIYQVNESAAAFYSRMLHSPRGKAAREYLRAREIDDELVGEFRLGYAPDGWDELARHLAGKKAPEKLMLAAGLVRSRDSGGVYDLLRDRVIFPIADPQGRIVGFGGRVLPGAADDAPKYVNSSEGPVFKKGTLLYGLDRAQGVMRKGGEALLVEGYTDVIACHRAGFTNTVAALGTAMTADHVRTLRRHAERAVMLFDPDEAGVKAARRAVEVAVSQGYEVRAGRLPDGRDPADLLAEGGPEALGEVTESAVAPLEFVIECATRGRDLADLREKSAAVEEVMDFASAEPSPVTRSLMRERVADRFGVPEDSLGFSKGPRKASRQPGGSGRTLTRRQRAERDVVSRLVLVPGMLAEVENVLGGEALGDAASREVLEAISEAGGTGGSAAAEDLVGRLESEEGKALVIESVEGASRRKRPPESELRAALGGLEGIFLSEAEEMESRLLEAEKAGDTATAEYSELLRERARKREQIQRIRNSWMGVTKQGQDGARGIGGV